MTAFIGPAPRGPVDEATEITGWADYAATFGGIASDSQMGAAVVPTSRIKDRPRRSCERPAASRPSAPGSAGADAIVFEAGSPGTWANTLRARVDRKRHTTLVRGGNKTMPWCCGISPSTTQRPAWSYFNISSDSGSPEEQTNSVTPASSVSIRRDQRANDNSDPVTGKSVWNTDPANTASTPRRRGRSRGGRRTCTHGLRPGKTARHAASMPSTKSTFSTSCVYPTSVPGRSPMRRRTAALDLCLEYCHKRRADADR